MERNKNFIPEDMFQLLQSSNIPFVSQLTSYSNDVTVKSDGKSKKPRTINSQFRDQLTYLMNSINATKTHYVRCIKSNDLNQRESLDRRRLVEQLKCAGVMEAVRISRSGYPYRMLHSDFYLRYRPLLTAYGDTSENDSLPWRIDCTKSSAELPLLCRRLIRALQGGLIGTSQSSKYRNYVGMMQIGRTKVFIRKDAYDVLESTRGHQLFEAVRKIQSMFRGYKTKKHYSAYVTSARLVQRAYKTFRLNKTIRSRILKRADSARRQRLADEQAEQERMVRERKELERKRLEAEEAERARIAAEEAEARRCEGMSERERAKELERKAFEMKVKMYIENIKNKERERRLAELQSKGVQLSLQ